MDGQTYTYDFTFNSPPPPPPPPPSTPPASPTPITFNPPVYVFEPKYDSYLFMTNYDGKRLAILDFSTNKIVANIPLSGHPKSVAFTPDSRKAYVMCHIDSPEPYEGICVVDLTQNEQVATIKLLYGGDAHGVVFSADGKVAYIVSGSFMAPGRGIWTYDTSTYQPLDYLSSVYGYRIFWSADGKKLVVEDGGILNVVDPGKVAPTKTYYVNQGGFNAVKATPDGKYLIAYDNKDYDSELYRISLSTYTAEKILFVDLEESTEFAAADVGISPDSKEAVLSLSNFNMIFTYDIAGTFGRRYHETIQGNEGGCVAFSPDGKSAYLFEEGAISIYKPSTAQGHRFEYDKAIPISFTPNSMTVHQKPAASGGSSIPTVQNVYNAGSSAKGRAVTAGSTATGEGGILYVCNKNSDTVSVVNLSTGAVDRTIPVPGGPVAMALSPDCGSLYVLCRYTDTVIAINTTSYATTGSAPIANSYLADIAASLDGKYLYITDDGPLLAYVMDATTLQMIKQISVSPAMYRLSVNPAGGAIYMTVYDEYSGSIPYLMIYDPITYGLAAQINPAGYSAPMFNADGSRAYVLDPYDDAVAQVDTGQKKVLYSSMVGVCDWPFSQATDEDRTRLYVASRNGRTVSIVDTAAASMIDTLDLSSVAPGNSDRPRIFASPNGTLLYLLYPNASKLLILDPASAKLTGAVTVGNAPTDLVLAYPRATATPQPVETTGSSPLPTPGYDWGKSLNLTTPGFFKVGGVRLSINGSIVNTSDGSSLGSLLSGGKLVIPLLVKGGEQVGEIEAPVTPGPNSSSGTLGGGTLILGQDGSIAGERGSLEVEADLKRIPDNPGLNVSFAPADEPLPPGMDDLLKGRGLTMVGRPVIIVHFYPQNLENGRDIGTAKLNFTVPRLDSGLSYYVLRRADDGKCTLLNTVYAEGPDSGSVFVIASSPDGFSTFALVMASGTPSASASPVPSRSPGEFLGVFAVLPLALAGVIALYLKRHGKG